MLPSDLLMRRIQGDEIVPKRLKHSEANLATATDVIEVFEAQLGETKGTLEAALQVLEGNDTDYRTKRGFAHILTNSFSEFEVKSPLEPADLRQKVFAASAKQIPSEANSNKVLAQVASDLSQETQTHVTPDMVRAGLYADLQDNHVLTRFDAPNANTLIDRYNLSQAQGVLYRASHIIITAYRNDPGEYKQLFRFLKLFGLMAYIEGDADHGFTITIDGPASLFKASTRYGTDLAKFLPALLQVSRWSMDATLVPPNNLYGPMPDEVHYRLDAECGLVSHYKPGTTYDSAVEEAFASRWAKTKTDWRLEREVDLLPIPGSVMVPDFRLVHPEHEKTYLLEIVGYWRPKYLQKKFAQVRKADRDDLILAVSERLNLEAAGVKLDDVPAKIIWFKGKVNPQDVLAAVA
ncbi:MAG: DUF790 family protein [Deinococcota bacterium]